MEYIPNNKILCYHTDTLQDLRNKYGFDTVKRVNDAINALEEWIAKQEHFVKKYFGKHKLKNNIITSIVLHKKGG